MAKTQANRFHPTRPILFALLATLCLLAGAISLTKIPDSAEQLAAKQPDILVTLTKPLDGSRWQLFSTIIVSVDTAGSQPAKSLELWVDGNLVETRSPLNGSAAWTWTIDDLDQHTLVVRALDPLGRAYNSNVVRVTGMIDPNPRFDMLYTSKDGDTVASIAASFGITPKKLAEANGPLADNGPIPAGKNLMVPISLPTIPLPPGGPQNPVEQYTPAPTHPAGTGQPNKFILWAGQFLQPKKPAAPTLALTSNGCSVQVNINGASSNQLGFNLYRLDPNSQAFKKIATLGPDVGSANSIQYVDQNLYGKFSYYAAAFNGQGEAQSNVATTNVAGPDCLTPFWSGIQPDSPAPGSPLPLQPAFPKPAKVDKGYYYFSVNQGKHQRAPKDPNQFLSLPGGIFNVSDQLGALILSQGPGPYSLDFDAWAWQGGILTHIGDFKKTVVPQPAGPDVSAPSLLQICSDPPCLNTPGLGGDFITHTTANQYSTWPLRWMANSVEVTAGLVQASIFPFDQTCTANPDGLVWSGIIPTSGNSFTNFDIDFVPLHTQPVLVNGWTINNNVEFYIRVLPQANGQTICEPSNSVTWAYQIFVQPTLAPTSKPTAAPSMTDPYIVVLSGVTPYQFADPGKAGCVQVTKNDYYQPLPAGEDYATWEHNYEVSLLQSLTTIPPPTAAAIEDVESKLALGYWIPIPVGGWLCPPPPAQPSSDSGNLFDQYYALAKATVAAAENGLEQLAHGYDSAKSWLVQNVASVIPICDSSTNQSDCEKVLSGGLDAGLLAIGLPPNLPTTQDALKVAEGNIADEVVSQMGDYCPDAGKCKAAVQAGLDQMIAHNAQDQSNSMCQSGICIPPQYAQGIVTAPWPTSYEVPSVATLLVIRRPDVPAAALPPFSCGLSLESTAVNDSWVGQTGIPLGDYNEVSWTGYHLEGQLFKNAYVGIPGGLAPGQSINLSVVLAPHSDPWPNWSFKNGFWISAHEQYDTNNLTELYPDSDDWRILYRGSHATFDVHETCFSEITPAPNLNFTIYPNLNNIFKYKLGVDFPQ